MIIIERWVIFNLKNFNYEKNNLYGLELVQKRFCLPINTNKNKQTNYLILFNGIRLGCKVGHNGVAPCNCDWNIGSTCFKTKVITIVTIV